LRMRCDACVTMKLPSGAIAIPNGRQEAAAVPVPAAVVARPLPAFRGLHSSTSQLNVSVFCGIGGAFTGYLRGVIQVSGNLGDV